MVVFRCAKDAKADAERRWASRRMHRVVRRATTIDSPRRAKKKRARQAAARQGAAQRGFVFSSGFSH